MTPGDSRPRSLADVAYNALRDRIVECRLAPGLRVTERQLAADLGIGVTPVRQALARLDSEGLVRTLPRRGYQVTPLTIESVNQLFQVWRILGPSIAELAAQHMPAQERARTFAKFRSGLAAAADEDSATFPRSAEELWMNLADGTGNYRLVSLYAQLAGELRRVFALVFQDPAAARALTALTDYENWGIHDAPAQVRASTEEFIDTAHRGVLSILTSWPSVVQAEVVPPVGWFLT